MAAFKGRDIQNFWEGGDLYMGDLAFYGGLENSLRNHALQLLNTRGPPQLYLLFV